MLAQATELGFWPVMEHLALFAALAGNLALVIALKAKPVPTPQPFEVREAHTYAHERDCKARHDECQLAIREAQLQRTADVREGSESRKGIYVELGGIRREMGEMERRLNAADETRTSEVHDRINQILEAVGEIKGRFLANE